MAYQLHLVLHHNNEFGEHFQQLEHLVTSNLNRQAMTCSVFVTYNWSITSWPLAASIYSYPSVNLRTKCLELLMHASSHCQSRHVLIYRSPYIQYQRLNPPFQMFKQTLSIFRSSRSGGHFLQRGAVIAGWNDF